MQKDKFIILPNKKDLMLYKDKGFNTFLLPLKDYSVSFDVYFNIDEINKLSKDNKIFVMINKFLHRSIDEFKKIYELFDKKVCFIVEDIGLLKVIDLNRVVLFEKHILSNYQAINYLNSLSIENVVINNDLTIDEIDEIRSKTKSKLYYFITGKNNIMYSRRLLITNYNINYKNKNNSKEYVIKEVESNKELYIREESESSVIFNNKIFNGNKYIDRLKKLDYLIINMSLLSSTEENIILDNYDKENLYELIDSDFYFLENDIKYKVGDL